MKKIRVKVKKAFLDLETGIYRKPGTPSGEMTISEKRYLELYRTGKGYVEAIKDATKGVAPKVENAEIKK
jgi:hypothetical protein